MFATSVNWSSDYSFFGQVKAQSLANFYFLKGSRSGEIVACDVQVWDLENVLWRSLIQLIHMLQIWKAYQKNGRSNQMKWKSIVWTLGQLSLVIHFKRYAPKRAEQASLIQLWSFHVYQMSPKTKQLNSIQSNQSADQRSMNKLSSDNLHMVEEDFVQGSLMIDPLNKFEVWPSEFLVLSLTSAQKFCQMRSITLSRKLHGC